MECRDRCFLHYISILLWFLVWMAYSWVWPILPFGAEMSGMFWIAVTSPVFWLGLLLVSISSLLPDVTIKTLTTMLKPSPREKLQMYLKATNLRMLDSNIEDPNRETHEHQPSPSLSLQNPSTIESSQERTRLNTHDSAEPSNYITRGNGIEREVPKNENYSMSIMSSNV